jgi:hypothetical protein
VWWRRGPSCGGGETLASGEPASGGPGAAIYREEKGREGRMAGRHGGVDHGRAGGGAECVAAREWARAPGDRVGDRIRQRLGVRGGRGAALPRPGIEERRRTVKTEKQRETARGRRKVEDDWTDLRFSKIPGTCL